MNYPEYDPKSAAPHGLSASEIESNAPTEKTIAEGFEGLNHPVKVGVCIGIARLSEPPTKET